MARDSERGPIMTFLSWVNEGGLGRFKNVLMVVMGPPLFVYYSFTGGYHVFAVCMAGMIVLPGLALALHQWGEAPAWLTNGALALATLSIPVLAWLAWLDYRR